MLVVRDYIYSSTGRYCVSRNSILALFLMSGNEFCFIFMNTSLSYVLRATLNNTYNFNYVNKVTLIESVKFLFKPCLFSFHIK